MASTALLFSRSEIASVSLSPTRCRHGTEVTHGGEQATVASIKVTRFDQTEATARGTIG
jgi:hypothetical protein